MVDNFTAEDRKRLNNIAEKTAGIEEHLRQLNDSVAKNSRRISESEDDIQTLHKFKWVSVGAIAGAIVVVSIVLGQPVIPAF